MVSRLFTDKAAEETPKAPGELKSDLTGSLQKLKARLSGKPVEPKADAPVKTVEKPKVEKTAEAEEKPAEKKDAPGATEPETKTPTGKDAVINQLNDILADELAAIHQYMAHAEICENWGYAVLHDVRRAAAITEMKHAEALMKRVVFLGGKPNMTALGPLKVGEDVPSFLDNDYAAETGAIVKYNKGISLAVKEDDNGTRTLLEKHLRDEEEHLEWLKAQRDQLKQMGLQNYLANQAK